MIDCEELIEFLCQNPEIEKGTGKIVIAQKLSLKEALCINKRFEKNELED